MLNLETYSQRVKAIAEDILELAIESHESFGGQDICSNILSVKGDVRLVLETTMSTIKQEREFREKEENENG